MTSKALLCLKMFFYELQMEFYYASLSRDIVIKQQAILTSKIIHNAEIFLYVCGTWQLLFCPRNSRQESWSGFPFPPPGHLPDPRRKPGSPSLQADSLPSELPGKSVTVKPRSELCDCVRSPFEPWSSIYSGENNCSPLFIMCANVGFTILENNA